MKETSFELIEKAWHEVVGRKIAKFARPRRMQGQTLIVEVEDLIWQRQMSYLSQQIFSRLVKIIGSDSPRELQFVVLGSRAGSIIVRQEHAIPIESAEMPEFNVDSDFNIKFAPECSAQQVQATLTALAEYYRACGGVGFQIDFEMEEVLVRQPVYV